MEGLTVKRVSNLLLVLLLLSLAVDLTLGSNYQKAAIFFKEWGIFLLPVLIYTSRKTGRVRVPLRLNPISFRTAVFAVMTGATGWAVATTMEAIITNYLVKSGFNPPPVPFETLSGSLWVWLFLVSVSAGVCEEILFRGFILRGYEEMGTNNAVFFSGLLFALMHASIARLLPILLLGILFSYMAVKLDSIYPTMLAHATNNGLSITVAFLAMKYKGAVVFLNAFLVLLFLVSLVGLPLLVSHLIRKTDPGHIPAPVPIAQSLRRLFSMWSFDLFMVIVVLLIITEALYITGALQKLASVIGG